MPTFLEYKARLDETKDKRAQVLADKGAAETALFDQNVLIPLTVKTATVYLNIRLFSLAALSMRRFVAGRLYLFMKHNRSLTLTIPVGQIFFRVTTTCLPSSSSQSCRSSLLQDI